MPFCPNPDCPHRKSLGEPAEFNKGVTTCSDCGSTLSETAPHFEPLRKPKAVTGWKCPECGSMNREDTSLCSCGFDSNRPITISDQRAKKAITTEVNASGFGGAMELTKQERKFAEISAKKYRRFFYRNSQRIGWFGVILFTIGLLRIPPLPPWSHNLLVQIGTLLTVSSTFTFAMTVAGKLYLHIKALETGASEKTGLAKQKE
jgi:DNA-directed RNA polymerase subunit RPC12/RpoP